jgi:hypothetical protein
LTLFSGSGYTARKERAACGLELIRSWKGARDDMTLVVYDADRLDKTALRILDVAAKIRQIAVVLREEPDVDLAIHDKKATEWLAQLENWAEDSTAKLQMSLIKRRGAKRAKEFPTK